MRRWGNKKATKGRPPPGYEIIEPILSALENELRDKVKESNVGMRNTESVWPVLQIQHQRTRYIFEMYHVHKRIPRDVYDYCIKNKIADAALIAKWKKPGYERLCSTYVINPANYKFGTVSICRVPLPDRSEPQRSARDPTTGCMGCASGKDAGPKNIFGNKYGQSLAAVQVAREQRVEAIRLKREDQEKLMEEERRQMEAITDVDKSRLQDQSGAGDSETDDDSDDDDDYGPAPAAGIWAGSKKLVSESETIADAEEDEEDEGRHNKKPRQS